MNRPRYRGLATDYDGTLADGGVVDPSTLEALRRARALGHVLVLVTGRELAELRELFPEHGVFDAIVAENGAVALLASPPPGLPAVRTLAAAPPAAFVEALRLRGRHRAPRRARRWRRRAPRRHRLGPYRGAPSRSPRSPSPGDRD